jgi:hypothetical protein
MRSNCLALVFRIDYISGVTSTEFAALKPGNVIRSFVQPSRLFTVEKKTADGYLIRAIGAKRPVKARTASAWELT